MEGSDFNRGATLKKPPNSDTFFKKHFLIMTQAVTIKQVQTSEEMTIIQINYLKL